MADLAERLETMEAYIQVLNEEKAESKMQMKKLESRLVKSEKWIQELEQQQQRQAREEAKCGFKKSEFKKMERRVSNLEQQQKGLQEQSQHASVKFEKIDKLQLLLNNMILKRQQADSLDWVEKEVGSLHDQCADLNATTERTSNQIDELTKMMDCVNQRTSNQIDELTKMMDCVNQRTSNQVDELNKMMDCVNKRTSNQMSELNKMMDCVNKELEEQRKQLPWQFHAVITRVRQHQVALSFEDYFKLSALEKIAGVMDGPGFRFWTNNRRGDSDRAESIRHADLEQLRQEGVTTTGLAMMHVVQLCGKKTTAGPHTVFYPVRWAGVERCILAIGPIFLRRLDENTKNEIKSWLWMQIRHCYLDEDEWIVLVR